MNIQVHGFDVSLNSYGYQRGKGVAVYIRSSKFSVMEKIKLPNLQLTYISSKMLDVIVMYRSSSCSSNTAIQSISSLLDPAKSTIVCGDFNLCYKSQKSDTLIQFLLNSRFDQKVTEATHIEGGTLDHVYFKNGQQNFDVDVSLYSPYFTALDHDALCVEILHPK